MKGKRCWAEVNLESIRRNISALRGYLVARTGAMPEIMAVVKADAYGHGMVPVAYAAMQAGCSTLGVGDSSEALELREKGITSDILILGAVIEDEISDVIDNDITFAIHSLDLLPMINREAKKRNKRAKVHIKVDTGMARLGISARSVLKLASETALYPHINLEGIFSHLACSNSGNVDAVKEQAREFEIVLASLKESNISLEKVHFLNSAGTALIPEFAHTMVRWGIGIYGIDPGVFAARGIKMEPALTLKTQICFVKIIPQGTPISYEWNYRTMDAAKIATCPIGYNDGYPWSLGSKGYAVVNGQRVPVVGNVTMDYIMIDVSSISEPAVGDEVTLIGKDGNAEITARELAGYAGTIPYEITCRLGRRVKRIYTGRERIAAESESESVPAATFSSKSGLNPQPPQV